MTPARSARVAPRLSRDPARRAAVDGLLAVEQAGAYLNLLLPRMLGERGLTGRDAAFATELGYGAARRSGVLLPVLADAAGRDPGGWDPAVRAVLVLGSYQLLHTRVPDRAAVSSSVDLVRELAGERPAGLVNAVLRRVAAVDWAGWVGRLAPPDPVGRLAFDAAYPTWIAGAFLDALGGDLDQLARLFADETRPAVHLAARPGRISRQALLEQAGDRATPGPWSPYAVHLAGGDPGGIPAVRDGRAGVQDEGSQLAALAVARAPLLGGDGGRWLDACAGPGGKVALLDGLRPPAGTLLAADLVPHRARLAAAAVPAAGVVVADATVPAWPEAAFDRVLLDVPCTGLGALRRRPEARWRREPDDVQRLARLQRGLLGAALRAVRPGGVVGYATCSPHLDETRRVVDAALGEANAQRLDARHALPMLTGAQGSAGEDPRDVQLWPHRHGTDAMYLALLRRRV